MNDDATSSPIASAAAEEAVDFLTSAPDGFAPHSAHDGGDSGGQITLEEAMAGTDLTRMTDAQVADLESGDPGRVEAALASQLPSRAGHEEGGLGPSRVSIKALKPEDRARTVQALDLIRAGRTPADAFAQVFGISGQPQPHEAAQPEPEPEHEAETDYAAAAAEHHATTSYQVAELEQSLASLQARYKSAKETYDPAATDLLEQMTDVKIDLRDARREAAAVDAHWMDAQAGSHARAMGMFGHLIADDSSSFVPLCDDEILLAEAKRDPILLQPDWPEKIGQRVMDKFFSGHAAHSPNPGGGLSRIPPAPRTAVRLPGSPVGPGFSAGALSPQTALAELDRLTPEQQDAFIQSLDHLTSAPKRR